MRLDQTLDPEKTCLLGGGSGSHYGALTPSVRVGPRTAYGATSPLAGASAKDGSLDLVVQRQGLEWPVCAGEPPLIGPGTFGNRNAAPSAAARPPRRQRCTCSGAG